MYDFIDRDTAQLDRGAQFLLWSMRTWVQAVEARNCPGPRLAPGFARSHVLSALAHFHGVMGHLSRDALQTMAFAPHCCRRVSEDEALLLSLFRAAQTEADDRLNETLAMLVTETSAAPLLASLSALMRQLAAFDLVPGLAEA
jgi:hypothetical protein